MQSLTPSQVEERMTEELCPYFTEVERPQHCCKQVCHFMMRPESQIPSIKFTKANKSRVLVGSEDEGLN